MEKIKDTAITLLINNVIDVKTLNPKAKDHTPPLTKSCPNCNTNSPYKIGSSRQGWFYCTCGWEGLVEEMHGDNTDE